MREIVITGVGVVSPIGIGRAAFSAALAAGKSGVTYLDRYADRELPVNFGGEVKDFDPRVHVRPRKSLKVMSRDIQFAVCAADLAAQDAGLVPGAFEPDRLGVVFGADFIYCEPVEVVNTFLRCLEGNRFDFSRFGPAAQEELFPLWMLKYLPNMPACHVGIAHDARGPTNSIVLGEVSSLLAIAEGARVIERGAADAMLVGGASNRLHPNCFTVRGMRDFSRYDGDPAQACRPFDSGHSGAVAGEGAAAFVLESRQHALRRGAAILASVTGYGSAYHATCNGRICSRAAIGASIGQALRAAELRADEVGHVNAHGLSTPEADAAEAQAIRDCLGDTPVTAPKSYFGNLGAGGGALEMAASVLALEQGWIPATLNYERPAPDCPIQVVRDQPRAMESRTALVLSQAPTGQAAAIVLAADA